MEIDGAITETEIASVISGRNPVFMFIGRTTPPTPGHLSVFLKMIELREKLGRPDIPILFNLSPSSPEKIKKGTKEFQDPLFCVKKIEYITSMLKKLEESENLKESMNLEKFKNVYPICIDSKENELKIFRPYQLANFIETHPQHPVDMVVVFIGKDRYKGRDSLVNYTVIGSRLGLPVEVFVMPRDVERDETSGTNVRNLITSTAPAEALPILKQMYTVNDTQLLSDEELEDLYRMVRSGMELGSSKIAPKKTRSVKTETTRRRKEEDSEEEPPRKTRSSRSKGKKSRKKRRNKFSKNVRK